MFKSTSKPVVTSFADSQIEFTYCNNSERSACQAVSRMLNGPQRLRKHQQSLLQPAPVFQPIKIVKGESIPASSAPHGISDARVLDDQTPVVITDPAAPRVHSMDDPHVEDSEDDDVFSIV